MKKNEECSKYNNALLLVIASLNKKLIWILKIEFRQIKDVQKFVLERIF